MYGRQVGRLLLTGVDGRSGVDVAERMIRDGKVFAYDGYLGRCDDLSYSSWEQEARQRRQGIWKQPGGLTRPWDVRDGQDDNPPPP